jgi:hypothetical protein
MSKSAFEKWHNKNHKPSINKIFRESGWLAALKESLKHDKKWVKAEIRKIEAEK